MEKVINVGLYGGKPLLGKGREKPLEASVIHCDMCNKCSYFQSNNCLNVRSIKGGFNGSCQFGSVENIKGYTSKAKKYYEFKNKWTEHEAYGKLNYPSDKIGVIDDMVVFPYPHISIKEESGKIILQDPYLSNGIAFIPKNLFTVDLIYRICKFRPQAMFGGEISSYQKEVVPRFIGHLKEVMPGLYQEFISQYKEFDKEVDYIGRKALLKTLNPGKVLYKSNSYPKFNEEWYWDGEHLSYENGYLHNVNITKNYEVVEFIIKPSDKSVVMITNNQLVKEDTVFID